MSHLVIWHNAFSFCASNSSLSLTRLVRDQASIIKLEQDKHLVVPRQAGIQVIFSSSVLHSPLIEESYFLCQFDLHMEQALSDRNYLLSPVTARKSTFLLTLHISRIVSSLVPQDAILSCWIAEVPGFINWIPL